MNVFRVHHGPRGRLVFCFVPFALTPALTAQTFTGLGHLPGVTYSNGFGVSGDGLVAVGWSDRAFRWTAAGGMQDLGTLGGIVSQSLAASDDGSFITGNGDLPPPSLFYNAFRWSSSEGMVSLGTLGASSYGLAISADGAVVVGHSTVPPSGASQAFRWTAGTGMQGLGTLPGDNASRAQGASADGTVIVGYSSGSGASRPFRWTEPTGMIDLGLLPGGNQAYAFGVSRDGNVIAGWGNTGGSFVAFRWTASGFTTLGTLPTGSGSFANAISGDGATIVGRADAAGFPRAFLWRADLGLVDLNTYLPTLGIDLSGWTLTKANGASNDGRTIVGDGTHNGASEAWILTLPASCYANCDASTTVPTLNIQDFSCFLNRFASGDTYANCDHSTIAPTLNVADFSCFLNRYAAGCP